MDASSAENLTRRRASVPASFSPQSLTEVPEVEIAPRPGKEVGVSAKEAKLPHPAQRESVKVTAGGFLAAMSALLSIAVGIASMAVALAAQPVPVQIHLELALDLRAALLLSGTCLLCLAAIQFRRPSVASVPVDCSSEDTLLSDGDAADVVEESKIVMVDQMVQADLPLPDSMPLPEDALMAIAEWRYNPAAYEEQRKRCAAKETVERLFNDMANSSPALVHRFPADIMARADASWSSPTFSACNRLWALYMGPLCTLGGAVGASLRESGNTIAAVTRYFVLKPQGHKDRLQFFIFLAKSSGQGFKERRVQDWPPELAGHPWGPSVPAEDIEQCLQPDGSLLVMVQAICVSRDDDLDPHDDS